MYLLKKKKPSGKRDLILRNEILCYIPLLE